jgi:hypothetical protein
MPMTSRMPKDLDIWCLRTLVHRKITVSVNKVCSDQREHGVKLTCVGNTGMSKKPGDETALAGLIRVARLRHLS